MFVGITLGWKGGGVHFPITLFDYVLAMATFVFLLYCRSRR